ncbi:uncharacterized protein [Eurosta solidaginis]|uniref:uncharacterized protein n=1 Tax=Eurosta solidaginis TaxID=178769 RepID=UPI003530F0AD
MPGKSCFLCKSTFNNKVSMFSPPTDAYLKGEWDTACGAEIPRSSKLCAKHFTNNDFSRTNPRRTRLQPDAVPSLHLTASKGRNVLNSIELGIINKDNYKKARAKKEQLLYYVRFARKHPHMLTSKYAAVRPLWAKLAKALNERKGVLRTPEKWRENLIIWRSQLRCRARQGGYSGVPEFDTFASNNYGLDSVQPNFGEDATQKINNVITYSKPKEVNNKDELNAEKEEFLPDEHVEVKEEIISSDDESTCESLKCLTYVPQYASNAEQSLDQEAETSIKTEIDIEDNEKMQQQQKSSKKNIKTVNSAIWGLTIDEPSGSIQKKGVTVTPPSQLPKETTALKDESETNMNTSATDSEHEMFIMKEIAKSAPQVASPTPQDPKTSETNRQHTLNKMYTTVLKSIQRREERTDGVMEVLKSLTAAVTLLADNVKRLEEKLTRNDL